MSFGGFVYYASRFTENKSYAVENKPEKKENKLLGFYVSRSKQGECKIPVWCGITEKEREDHRQWILDNVADQEYDGETTFRYVESEIIIKATGLYKTDKGGIIRIERIKGREAFGYIQKETKTGKLKDKTPIHFWINGVSFSGNTVIVGQFFS